MTKLNTRERLILAGERLFAEDGIDAVSLRQVNLAAGQRNSSASHYHFGSKQKLIEAIYEYRMERVNKRSVKMLNALEMAGSLDNIHALVGAVIYPIVDEMWTENATHYVRFLAQAVSHPSNYMEGPLKKGRYTEGMTHISDLMRKILADLPESIFRLRFGLMLDHTMHALADRKRIIPMAIPEAREIEAVFTSNLVDSIAAALSATVSNATKRELNDVEKIESQRA
jgi:AcrR family transcriptional regulator